MGVVTIGVDLGQRVDSTAIAAVTHEARQAEDGRLAVHHVVRWLERLPLGTTYPDVARRVAEVSRRALAQPGITAGRLYVDATGLGKPVIDLMREQGVRAIGVYFTHGDRRTETPEGVTLGKAWLVSRLQTLLQSGRLHVPRTTEAEALAAELLAYEIRVGDDANDRYGAFKVGTHDDLVTALGLATQIDPSVQRHSFEVGGYRPRYTSDGRPRPEGAYLRDYNVKTGRIGPE